STTPSWASSTASSRTRAAGRWRSSRAAAMADCVFCMIRDGKIPSAKVYDDQRTLAFMDINPLSRGHCLVVPKAHAATLYEAETADLKAATAAAKQVAGDRRNAVSPGR